MQTKSSLEMYFRDIKNHSKLLTKEEEIELELILEELSASREQIQEFEMSQKGYAISSYSSNTQMPKTFIWDIPHVNKLFKELKNYLKKLLPHQLDLLVLLVQYFHNHYQ